LDTVAIIPARRGSKGIPYKNRQLIGPYNLVEWSILSLQASGLIDTIILSTDDECLLELQSRYSLLQTTPRPPVYSSDHATTESVISYVIDNYVPTRSKLLLVQPTSPFRSLGLIRRTLDAVTDDLSTSLTVYAEHLFLWSADGLPNYDIYNRSRRQDIPSSSATLIETGSLFCFTRDGFDKYANRLYGNITPVRSNYFESLEIDAPLDLLTCQTAFNAGCLPDSIYIPR